MTVLITNDTPPAIRGILKRWFVEPKPNVFIGTLNKRTRDKTIEYILRNAKTLGMLVLSTEDNSQGFSIRHYGDTDRIPVLVTGHFLVAEKWQKNEPTEEIPSSLTTE